MAGLALAAFGCAESSRVTPAAGAHDHLRVRLISSAPILHPGMTCTLGVHFELEDGWHLYGNGRSDSGLPISVAFDLPTGVRTEPVLWPTPERLVTAGEILDQVYEGSATLLAPLVVSPDFATADRVPVVCRLEWLVCGPGCIPGADTLTLALPFERADRDRLTASDDPWMARAVERLPDPWPENDAAHQNFPDGNRWVVQVEGARSLTFFPGTECPILLDPIRTTRSEGDRLELRLDPRAPPGGSIRGILAVDRGGDRVSYVIDAAALDPIRVSEPTAPDPESDRTEMEKERNTES